MSLVEEVIEATLDENGKLQLSHQPRLPAGPVWVTIRTSATTAPRRTLTDVVRGIAGEQRARGFAGRSAEELREDEDARQAEDVARDQELGDARRNDSTGSA